MKNKTLFNLGIFTGVLFILLCYVNTFLFYKIGIKLTDKLASAPEENKLKLFSKSFASNFHLGFETPNEANFFKAQESQVIRASEHATEGVYSLKVKFPQGASYPGLFFESTAKEYLDWSKIREFSADIFNSSLNPVELTIKIKSGLEYPKRGFEKDITLNAQDKTTLLISRDELKNLLDLGKITYLNFFIQSPGSTAELYFDNMRALPRNGE